jgi:hypothetical protein
VSPPIELAVAILLPIAAVYGLIGGGRLLRWAGERRSRPPATEPVEQLAGRLRRLRSQLEAMETRTDLPAKNLRVRALRAAYVDVLRSACQRLEITPPGESGQDRGGQIPLAEIYRAEAELRRRGLDVRETAGR